MAESVQLGSAYVTFTADFKDLMEAIDDAVRLSKQGAKQIEDALGATRGAAKKTGASLAAEFVKAATTSVSAWNSAANSIRAGLRKLTSELVFIQLDVSHLANLLQRMAAVGTAAIGGMTAASMSFEDAFANVRKTVDASEAEFRQLEQSLRQMSTQTRTSASDLALIMSTAGQLGVRGVDNLTKFTRTIDMLQVATNIVGQEGAQALAQFMNIMQENLGNVDRVGAAITELGNNFAATEADILNMAQRLAGAGKTIGLTTADVLGLATALSAVGIRAEMGGSALSRVLINMSQAVEMQDERLREFARTAGMSAREFADTFRRDPVRALQAFIEGLRRLDSEGKNVFVTLENVGASEIRVRDTLLRLFQASDLLADAVERSNRAWEENIALTEEFDRFMGTGVARLRMMWNTIVEVARIVGDVYNPIIKQAADFTQGVADALRRMTPEQQRAIAEFGALATAVLGGIAAFLLAIKTIATFATGLVLLTRAVVFFLSPWTLLTMAVIAAAIAIATKWDEIRETIAQTDLGKAAIEAWESLKKVWQSDELTLPEKIIESVRITVRFVTGLIESIRQWWLGASIKLARRGAELLGLDPDNAWLPAFLTRLDEIWKNEDLTFGQKIVKSVVITVESVLGLIDSITSWWLDVTVRLARKTVKFVGLDPDESALVALVEKIKEWWDNEDITLAEKVIGVVTVFAGLRWMLRALTTFAQAVAEKAGLIGVGGAAWLFRLGWVTVSARVKWALVATGLAAGATLLLMDKETRDQLLEQVRNSFQDFREDINRIWTEEFGEEWRQALQRAAEEGRIFDPITVVVENITKTVRAFRQSLAPVTKIIRDWVAGVFGDISLSEAFQRGLETGEIDPRAAAAWKSFMDLGGAIAELLMESIGAAFDVLDLVGYLFLGPLAKTLGVLAEVGAEWAGAMTKGFKEKWDEFMARFEQWWENTWLARLLKQLSALFNLGSDRQAQFTNEEARAVAASVKRVLMPGPMRVSAVAADLLERSLTTEAMQETATQVRLTDEEARAVAASLKNVLMPGPARAAAEFIEYSLTTEAMQETATQVKLTDDEIRAVTESLGWTPAEFIKRDWREPESVQLSDIQAKLTDEEIRAMAEFLKLGQTSRDMQEPTLRVQLTEDEIRALAALVYAEAAGEPFEGKVAVAEVVLNRLLSRYFPNTLEEVIRQPGQFEPVMSGRYDEILKSQIDLTEELRAVRVALEGSDFAKGALFFFNPIIVAERNPGSWMLNPDLFLTYTEIGRHRFGTEIRGGVPLRLQEGIILPGFGGGDRIPALLEPGEAVVPAKVVRGGLADIVAWFRRMGVVKMQTGGIVGADLATLEAEYRAVSADMTQFANRLLEGIKEITDTLSAWIFGAAQLIVDVLKALFPDHADAIQQSFESFKAMWERWFRQQPQVQEDAVKAGIESAQPPQPVPSQEELTFWQKLLAGLEEFTLTVQQEWRKIAAGLEVLSVMFPDSQVADAMNSFYAGIQRMGKVVEFFQSDQFGINSMIDGFHNILTKAHEVFESLVEGLGPLGMALTGFFMAGGRGISGVLGAIGGFLTQYNPIIGLGLTLIGGLINTIWDKPERVLENFPLPDPGEDILSIGETWQRWSQLAENQRRLEEERRKLVKQQEQIRNATIGGAALGAVVGGILFGPVGALLGGLFGGSAGQKAAEKSLESEIKRTEEEIRRLTELIHNAKTDIINALGISMDDFARGIAAAFRAPDIDSFAEELGKSVREQIRNAMVQVFIAQILEPQIKALAEMVQAAFLEGKPLNMEVLDEHIANIVEISRELYERFEELGLVTDETSEKLRGMSYNIPRIFRVNLERWRVADVRELPSLADEGYITRSGLAMVHAGEIVAKAERFGGGNINVTVNVYGDGWDSERLRSTIRREVTNAIRDSMAARYGIAPVGV